MKKRIFSLILAFLILFPLFGCQGNFATVDLQEAQPLPEDGSISQSALRQMKKENAIATFTGSSAGTPYEWTIFGSDITDPRSVNLGITITTGEEVTVTLSQDQPFGFSALLSIRLPEQWSAQTATAYADGNPIATVSLTGSKTTILNLTVDGNYKSFVIRPDELPEDAVTDTTTPSETTPENTTPTTPDNSGGGYLTPSGGKDKYNTDPIPEGKPKPVEPEDQEVDKEKTYTCTFSIECSTILNNLDQLEKEKLEMVPSDGVILKKVKVTFYEGESVFDVLQRLCKEKGIHLESSWTPIYNSAYVEGIHNLYEFDCGALSGWMYRVNGWYPNYGCSRYQLKDGDKVEWRYTCDLGHDVGGAYAVGG